MSASAIHPTAIVDPGATVGAGVSIGPYAVIEGDVRIGDGCSIGPHVMIGEGTRIGRNGRVFHGASLGQIPQDKKFSGEKTFLHIGDNAFIREFCTINRGTSARGETRIGANCWIMAYCHIAHDCILGDDVTISNSLAMAGHVEVGSFVTIGGIVPIHQFVRIGDHAFIASVARPFMDVVPFAMVGADPTRIAGINQVGLERRGFSAERIREIKRAFRVLFRRNLPLAEAVKALETDWQGNPDVTAIADFVKGSTRGLIRMQNDE